MGNGSPIRQEADDRRGDVFGFGVWKDLAEVGFRSRFARERVVEANQSCAKLTK
jgi:hypothetical protein